MYAVLLLLVALAAPPSVDEYRDAATGIDFPASLGTLGRVNLTRYSAPELGLSVRYSAPNLLKTDIYVYHAGLKGLGTGQTGDVVQQHFAEVKQNIFTMQDRGKYSDVKLISEEEIAWSTGAGSLPLLHAVFNYSDLVDGVPTPRTSHVYLATYKDHFVKIRYTYLSSQKAQGEAALRLFLPACGRMLH
jgi:hypothetical protein